jgi:tRNA-dihydrouridine synthase B
MLTSDPRLQHTRKSATRRDHSGETAPVGVQLAGADPAQLAEAARFNVDQGAQIIDINMGCPAKKVLKTWAGSALLRDEALVGRILDAVVAAVDVPVTLKIRTGWDCEHKNGVAIARIAEQAGIAALAVHGRTRAMRFSGHAEYETIAEIKRRVAIPVIANGDIVSVAQARDVLRITGADALMIGRGAQGRPWIFREFAAGLSDAPAAVAEPDPEELGAIMREHAEGLYALYGDAHGVRVARKHLGWYLEGREGSQLYRAAINCAETPAEQIGLIESFIAHNVDGSARIAA